ncbi:NAD(P)-binding protein [Streptomyces roseoverticillatus]|uniref:NAD(P)-binding protein n=1 Tax=Streptomyces roseoverticillatus TaxID=66429 RepID=UPI0004C0C634|nr:NAD(P)-binding protein [Streptomyces roseoverticillatus]
MTDSQHWDAIVVGSGLAGLTAAAYLTANGMRTLVLEQWEVAGGYSHVLRRRGQYESDVGIHYIGDCEPGGTTPAALMRIAAQLTRGRKTAPAPPIMR